jgi:hypothetical protein
MSAETGMVAVRFASETARHSSFTVDLESLELPEGTRKKFDYGPNGPRARNDVVRYALEVAGAQWIWFIDDEHSFPPEIVRVLLSHDEPIVCPIVIDRVDPFYPLSYTGVSRAGNRLPLLLDDVTGPGTMMEITSAHTNGMLVRREVFEALGKTWWFEEDDPEDELSFCDRARAAGFGAFVDTSMRLGNHCSAVMFPSYRGGKWELSVLASNGIEMSEPMVH